MICWCEASPPSHCSTWSSLLREIQLCTEQAQVRLEGAKSIIANKARVLILTVLCITWTYLWVSPHIWYRSPGPRTYTATPPVCSPRPRCWSGYDWLSLWSDSTHCCCYPHFLGFLPTIVPVNLTSNLGCTLNPDSLQHNSAVSKLSSIYCEGIIFSP